MITPQPPRPIRIELVFTIVAIAAIFTQKIAIPSGTYLPVPVAALWTALLYLMIRGAVTVDPLRLILFAGFICAIALDLMLQGLSKPMALLLLLSMYAPMMLRIDVDRATLLRCLNPLQNVMMVIAWVVIGQQLIQFTIGSAYWPDFENFVPKGLLIEGYAYKRPYNWGSNILTPNGIFFLEPAGLSLFVALALATEIVWFKRVKRIGLYGISLLSCMAGTGITVTALLSPLLVRHLDRRLVKPLMMAGIPLLLIAVLLGAFDHLLDRSTEFESDNSSAYGRMVVPFQDTVRLIGETSYLISGQGPGSTPKGTDSVQWPANKLIYEYGTLTSLTYHAFLVVAALANAPSITLVLFVLLPHLFFGGGIAAPSNIVALMLFCTLFRIKPDTVPVATSKVRWRSMRIRAEGVPT